MRKEQEAKYDPSRPALIVLYGATRKKFRPLEGELTVIGRAPGCDIGLVSPEVAPVHCIIVRVANGWRIRDCSGRATRVNGKAIQEEPLRNGDTIQVGTFSFEAQLPATLAPIPTNHVAGPLVDRLQRSRRRLVQLALGMRQRVRELTQQLESEQSDLERYRADLEMLEHRLRQAVQENQTRQNKLLELEAALKKRTEEFEQLTQKQQREAQEQITLLEKDVIAQRVELKQEAERLAEWKHELQARQTELETTAAQVDELLCREREQLDHERQKIAEEREQVRRERLEVIQLRAEMELLRDALAGQTPSPLSSRETKLDAEPSERLESARKLLRDLAGRRKAAEPAGSGSRGRQPRPAADTELE